MAALLYKRLMGGDTDSARELVDALKAQVADLARRLDAAELERAGWQDERGRLLALVERLTERAGGGNALASVENIRAEAAERRAAERQAVVDGDLVQLRAMLAALARREQRATPHTRPRRRG